MMRIGGNDYSANVVVGMRKNGKMLLYDIANMTRTQIQKRYSVSVSSNSEAARTTASSNDIVQQQKESVKFSLSDTQYLDLAKRYESGDKSVESELRKTVDDAARNAGAATISNGKVKKY